MFGNPKGFLFFYLRAQPCKYCPFHIVSLCDNPYFLLIFVGNDGVELNVLDNILGEQVNDEFADELDTATVKASGKWIE